MKNPENPAALLSKELLEKSLIYFIKIKPYNDITITELTEKAQVGRRTFYRHFNSKDDILAYHIKKMCREYNEALINTECLDTYNITVKFFEICLAHIDFLLLLKKQGLMIFMLNEFDRLLPLLHEKFITQEYKTEYQYDIDYVLYFHTGGFWNITNKWLEDHAIKTPSEMAEIVSKIMRTLI